MSANPYERRSESRANEKGALYFSRNNLLLFSFAAWEITISLEVMESGNNAARRVLETTHLKHRYSFLPESAFGRQRIFLNLASQIAKEAAISAHCKVRLDN